MRRAVPEAERFHAKIEVAPGPLPTECWLWTGALDKKGYGVFNRRSPEKTGTTSAHRASFEMFKRKLLPGEEVDHLCAVRRCARPEHLDAVTHQENIARVKPEARARIGRHRRGRRGRRETAKISCVHGHQWEASNIYTHRNGNKGCRTCKRDRLQAYKRKVRSAGKEV